MSKKLDAVTDEQKAAAKSIFTDLAAVESEIKGLDAKIAAEKSALADRKTSLIVALHDVAGGRKWKNPATGENVTPVVRVKKKTGEQEVYLRRENQPQAPVEI